MGVTKWLAQACTIPYTFLAAIRKASIFLWPARLHTSEQFSARKSKFPQGLLVIQLFPVILTHVVAVKIKRFHHIFCMPYMNCHFNGFINCLHRRISQITFGGEVKAQWKDLKRTALTRIIAQNEFHPLLEEEVKTPPIVTILINWLICPSASLQRN